MLQRLPGPSMASQRLSTRASLRSWTRMSFQRTLKLAAHLESEEQDPGAARRGHQDLKLLHLRRLCLSVEHRASLSKKPGRPEGQEHLRASLTRVKERKRRRWKLQSHPRHQRQSHVVHHLAESACQDWCVIPPTHRILDRSPKNAPFRNSSDSLSSRSRGNNFMEKMTT